MQQVDRWVGAMLALLGTAVLWSSRAFPAVPGQKVGAGFLPGIIGAGLVLCALLLVWRSTRSALYGSDDAAAPRHERYAPAAVVVGVCLSYILLADRLGFLIVAPLGLLAVFRAFRARLLPSLLWAVGGALVIHLAFYKLLRVPLPWGVFRPLY